MTAFDLDRIGGARALRRLVTEVVAAGEDALCSYRDGAASRAQLKPDRSPVTEADHAAERRLRAHFDETFPDIGFLGEETGSREGTSGMRWLVDPIDGTRAFLRGIPTWSVLVGLEDEHGPAIGIAFMPSDGDLFVAVRGDGATGNGRPLRVSEVRSLGEAVVSHGGLNQFTTGGETRLLERLGEGTFTQRGFGDFDGYRQLVLGRIDAMVDPGVKPWDVCAAAVLVTEAGGRLTSLRGEPTIHAGSSLASNGHLHDALLSLLG
jgi:histidinol-phosphatase